MGTLLQITEIALQTKETHVLRFIESIWWNFVPNSLYGIGEVITWPKWPTNVGLFFINPPTLPMLSLSGLNQLTRNVYLSICVFVYLYLRFWHMGISFLTSLNNPLFKNIPHGGSFWHFVICCICVFVCLCICVFVFGLGRSLLDQFGQKNASPLSSTFWFERPKLRYVLKTLLHCKGSQILYSAITHVSSINDDDEDDEIITQQ